MKLNFFLALIFPQYIISFIHFSNFRNSIPLSKVCLEQSKGFARNEKASDSLPTKLKGTCVYFVGMTGSGKSTVGANFAERMGYRFLDTDEIAEYMIEMPISKYFSDGNESQFRELEYQILMELSQYTRLVVATGGGIVLKNENWGLLRHGIIVYLDLDVDEINNRLTNNPIELNKRPLLQNSIDSLAVLQNMYETRVDKYQQADVHVRIKSEQSVESVVALVIETISRHIDENPPKWQTWKAQRDQKALSMASSVYNFFLYIYF
jgi:shikimate kinase